MNTHFACKVGARGLCRLDLAGSIARDSKKFIEGLLIDFGKPKISLKWVIYFLQQQKQLLALCIRVKNSYQFR